MGLDGLGTGMLGGGAGNSSCKLNMLVGSVVHFVVRIWLRA